MRNMLRKLNANPAWTAEGGFAVNDLDDATEIVFTGTSAGAKGAISNADWFLSVFPASDNSLVVDANFDVSDGVLLSAAERSETIVRDGTYVARWIESGRGDAS